MFHIILACYEICNKKKMQNNKTPRNLKGCLHLNVPVCSSPCASAICGPAGGDMDQGRLNCDIPYLGRFAFLHAFSGRLKSFVSAGLWLLIFLLYRIFTNVDCSALHFSFVLLGQLCFGLLLLFFTHGKMPWGCLRWKGKANGLCCGSVLNKNMHLFSPLE